MRVAFRVDFSLDIGTGHVMRCLTLAEALRNDGMGSRFLSRRHPGHLIETIRGRGFPVEVLLDLTAAQEATFPVELRPVHAAWLGTDWASDARQSRAVLAGSAVDWLIVDHYALDARWERGLRGCCRRLMIIDDLADREHDCDLLLDQNSDGLRRIMRVLRPRLAKFSPGRATPCCARNLRRCVHTVSRAALQCRARKVSWSAWAALIFRTPRAACSTRWKNAICRKTSLSMS